MLMATHADIRGVCGHSSCNAAGLYNKMSSQLSVQLTDCEGFLTPALDALQRVMDEYSSERPTSKGGRPFGLASPAGSSASQWESAEHVQTNISHLSSTLAGVDAYHLWNISPGPERAKSVPDRTGMTGTPIAADVAPSKAAAGALRETSTGRERRKPSDA